MKKKNEINKFSASVKGTSISANETDKVGHQKEIKFNKNNEAVPATPESIKQEKKMVQKAENKSISNSSSIEHKYLGLKYHEFHIEELQQKAREVDLEGRSNMNKEELITALYENHSKEEIYDIATNEEIAGRSKMSKNQLINELRKKTQNTPQTKGTSSNYRSSSQSKTGSSKRNSSQNSSSGEYYSLTREELYEEAKKKDIDGRSKMDKDELLEALYENHTREELYEKAKKEDIKGRSSMSKTQLIKELQTA